MLKKWIFLIPFVAIINIIGIGQTTHNSTYQSDTAFINRSLNISNKLLYINPDSSAKYIDTVILLSTKINYRHGLFLAYNQSGIIYWMSNNMKQAIVQYKLALRYTSNSEIHDYKAKVFGNIGLAFLKIFNNDSTEYYLRKAIQYSESKNLAKYHAKAILDLAAMYSNTDRYAESAHYLLQAKEQLKTINDSKLNMFVYYSFGILYSKVNEFDSSLLNFKKAIKLDKQLVNINNIANYYISIGQLYFNLKQNRDSATYYYRKASYYALPYEKRDIEMAANVCLGNVFMEYNQLDSAAVYYKKAMDDTLINSFPDRKAAMLVNLGYYYLKNSEINKSRDFLNRGFAMADSLGILVYKKNALRNLAELDSVTGNYKDALECYKAYHDVSDSLKTEEALNEIAILNFKKFIEQKNIDNQRLIKKNTIKNYMIWVSIIVILILLLLIIILFRTRSKIKLLVSQLSSKHEDLQLLNEELSTTNEVLKVQQEELRALNSSKDKFFSILGHDLKSPFNGLLGMLDLLADEWDNIEDNEKQGMISLLHSSSKKTLDLLNDVLSWGKIQRGMVNCNAVTFTVYPKIKEIMELLDAQLSSKNQYLVVDIAPDIEINTDAMLFTHIVQNLLNNAIKYTPEGGSITVKAETINLDIRLCVTDTGIGIPEDQVTTIFDIDNDFKRPGTNNEKSTGMGLLLSKEYAKLINAKLSVSSIVGEGSSFCLILPI